MEEGSIFFEKKKQKTFGELDPGAHPIDPSGQIPMNTTNGRRAGLAGLGIELSRLLGAAVRVPPPVGRNKPVVGDPFSGFEGSKQTTEV